MNKQRASRPNAGDLANPAEDALNVLRKSYEEALATEEAKLKNASAEDRLSTRTQHNPFLINIEGSPATTQN